MTDYTPTTLGFAILGLLQEESRTGYAVRKVFESTPMGNYSSSPGSLYPALRRLREEGLVRTESRRHGQLNVLTREGRAVLVRWLREPVDPADVPLKDGELLLRFAFMGELVDDATRSSFLDAFGRGSEAQAAVLEAFGTEQQQSLSRQAWVALDHGIARARADAEWARRARETLKK